MASFIPVAIFGNAQVAWAKTTAAILSLVYDVF